jgi:hypothetical protein
MTTLEIEILLWYFCRAEDHKDAFNPPPSQKEAFARFVENGYLEDNSVDGQIGQGEMTYSPTEKLHVYCEALCKVPEPRQEWVI